MSDITIEQLPLGTSDLTVSNLGFGTYKLGQKLEAPAALELLGRAYDAGITLFDTSDNYLAGEALIGLALRDGILPRDEVVIATKTGLAGSEYEAREFGDRRHDTSPERIRRKVEGSLRVLGVEAIDLYQVHVHDPSVEADAVASVMNDLIGQGKIRHWGISNYNTPSEVNEAAASGASYGLEGPVSLQNFHNLLNHPFAPAIDAARSLGMTVLAFSPLNKGVIKDAIFNDIPRIQRTIDDLTGDDPEVIERKTSLEAELHVRHGLYDLWYYAQQYGYSTQQLAIAWLMRQPNTVPLLGAYRSEYLDELVQAADWKISDSDAERLDQIVHKALG